MAKKYWLMKTEPTTFSYDDLEKAPKKTTSWEGVRNYQARNLMRDEMKLGDAVIIYHSSTDEPAAVGMGEIVKVAYPDPNAMDPKHKYFDPKSKARGTNPWLMVDVKAAGKFKAPVTRDRMRQSPALGKALVLSERVATIRTAAYACRI
ncbi:MAG: EVE domain-containing protein [Bdellovibrionales bacterium]|nr:EVE domain-containing protein [Bdellovibrionales bacterium]